MIKGQNHALFAKLYRIASLSAALILVSGCNITPSQIHAQEILTKALTSSTPLPGAGLYTLTESEEYSLRPSEPPDPFHKTGMKPARVQIKFWQSGDSRDTYRMQRLNPQSDTVLFDVTQSVVTDGIVRHTHDVVAAVEFTASIPLSNQANTDTTVDAAEIARRKAIDDLAKDAVVSRFQSTATNNSAYRIVSSKDFVTDQAPTQVDLSDLLKQEPKKLKYTFDIDEQTYEILSQSTVAVMSDGSEHLLQSRQLITRTSGNLASLPENWLVADGSIQSKEARDFDIHQEAIAGRANEQVEYLANGRVISVIRGPKATLTQGLQSVAPVWDASSEITLTVSSMSVQAWLCEGGILASDPIRRVLIFTRGDTLYYITGQSFTTSDDFVKAAIAQLER